MKLANNLREERAERLAVVLVQHPALAHLNIRNNHIEAEEASRFVESAGIVSRLSRLALISDWWFLGINADNREPAPTRSFILRLPSPAPPSQF